MRPVVLFIGLVVVLLVAAGAGTIYVVMNAAPPPRRQIPLAPVAVEPDHVDLGAVAQCDAPIEIKARLVNRGTEVFHLTQVITSCGCTVPDLATPVRFEPGATHDFVITIDPWAESGPRARTIDFFYAEASRGPNFSIAYEAQSPIRTRPGAAHRQPDAVQAIVKITAEDGEPFLIERIVPAVTEDWVRTPTGETHLTIDWSMVDEAAKAQPKHFEFDADGRWKRGIVTIGTTREDCREVHLRVYNVPKDASHAVRLPASPTPGAAAESAAGAAPSDPPAPTPK